MDMEQYNKAWVAGFVDGEGYIGERKVTRNGYEWGYVILRISQAMQEPLDRICEMYGGAVFERKPLKNRKRMWEFCIQGDALLIMLRDIRPYSIVKRDKISDAIIFLEQKLKTQRAGKHHKPNR